MPLPQIKIKIFIVLKITYLSINWTKIQLKLLQKYLKLADKNQNQ